MTTLSVVLDDDCLHVYDGTGLGKAVSHRLPNVVFDANTTYQTLYDQAKAFVTTALAGATKIVVANTDSFGMRGDDGEVVVPRAVADTKGFVTISSDTMRELVIKFVNETSKAMPGLIIKNQNMKYYCHRCGELNKSMTALNSPHVRVMSDCEHRETTGKATAFALWHTLVPYTP